MDSNYIKVFGGNSIEAQRVELALKENNIEPILKDETESARLAGFGASVYGHQDIYVHKDELAKATSIIENTNLEIEP